MHIRVSVQSVRCHATANHQNIKNFIDKTIFTFISNQGTTVTALRGVTLISSSYNSHLGQIRIPTGFCIWASSLKCWTRSWEVTKQPAQTVMASWTGTWVRKIDAGWQPSWWRDARPATMGQLNINCIRKLTPRAATSNPGLQIGLSQTPLGNDGMRESISVHKHTCPL